MWMQKTRIESSKNRFAHERRIDRSFTHTITLQNAVERLILKTEGNIERGSELDFAANNLLHVSCDSKYKNVIEALGVHLSAEVLKRPSLVIPDEDSLLELILALGGEYIRLVEFVECTYLSDSAIPKLLAN